MKITAVSVALDERDHLTSAHCGRVAGLSLELGKQCALPEHELRLLQTAAIFHDVGKIGIPDAVLMKTVPLTAADWAIMKTHSVKSQRIILAAGLDDGDVIGLVARHHHERYDGGGYPDGLRGEAIPIMARIVALADAYDAMARTRVYRHAVSHNRIMQALFDAQGRQHDPYLYTKFTKLIERSEFKADTTSSDDRDERLRDEDLLAAGH
jgi:HD-GYP domain-containing protein (c-di-GMP phosphodiesterase class II)